MQFFLKFGVLFAILAAIALFLGLIASWIGGIWGLTVALPYLDYVSPYDRGTTWFGIFNLFFLFVIPVIALLLLFARIIFRKRTPGVVKAGLGIVWFISLFSAVGLGTYGATGFVEEGALTKSPDLGGLRSDTLRVEWSGSEFDLTHHGRVMSIEGLRLDREGLTVGSHVNIHVRRTTAPFFECTQIVEARGRTSDEAVENAASIQYDVAMAGNKLLVPRYYFLPKGSKWRDQEITLTIGVPLGKSIVFGPTINDRVQDSEYAGSNSRYHIYNNADRVFRMTEQGLVCTECPAPGEVGYEEDRHYENFILEGDFRTEITHSDKFSIRMEGSIDGKDARTVLQTVRTGDKLTVTTNGVKTNGAVRLHIGTPVFTSLFANGGDIAIRGFEEGEASVDLKNNARLRALIDATNLELNLAGPCQAELTGRGERLDANLINGAVLEAGSWRTNEAEISATEGSRAHLHVKSLAIVNASRDSQVRVDGGAQIQRPDGEAVER